MKFPSNWQLTQTQLHQDFGVEDGTWFKWLTEDKRRAAFSRHAFADAEMDLTLFGGAVPIQEAVVDFHGGTINVITISIYNRGDGGSIEGGDFQKRFKEAKKALTRALGVKPVAFKADKRQGLLRQGQRWDSSVAVAVLEHDEGAMMKASPEFLRLRVARKHAPGRLANAMNSNRPAALVRCSDLPANVKKDREGNVLVTGLPMVDQGDKGYCVVASVQRLFEYYGIDADMHQIAEVAGSDPKTGTSTLQMARELGKIDYRFKTRLDILGMLSGGPEGLVEVKRGFEAGNPLDQRKFMKAVRSRIDAGQPLLWSLELGRYPEFPDLNPQTSGGHMRMIIGYNDRTEQMIFSDSWGAGHERKTMKMEDAYLATTGLFALQPTVR